MVAAENRLVPLFLDSTDECKGADKTSAERAEDPFALLSCKRVETVPDTATRPKIVGYPAASKTVASRSGLNLSGNAGGKFSPGQGNLSPPVGSGSTLKPALPPPPPLPEPGENRCCYRCSSVGSDPQAIVKVPNEATSRYVRVGQQLANGQVLVKD